MPRRLLTRPNKVGVSTRKLWPGIPCVNCRAESGVLSLKKGRGVHGDLPVHRRQHLGSDVSLAPSGERSLQGMVLMHAGAVLMWETGRRPFTTFSTAESELPGYREGAVMSESTEGGPQESTEKGPEKPEESPNENPPGEEIWFEKLMIGDNLSALSILTKPDGPWRTRRLRLRSNYLREKLASSKGNWKVCRQEGARLCAGLTNTVLGNHEKGNRPLILLRSRKLR